MRRVPCRERPDWKQKAAEFGFRFHTLYGQAYWDESAYYAFTLEQIETQLEDPTAELHQMCLHAVDVVVKDEQWMQRFQIPPEHWDFVRQSWFKRERSLYSRMDLVYDGRGPAKLLENNADTPTSLYETGFWQWLWLEDKITVGELPASADQFNSLQDKLLRWFEVYRHQKGPGPLHFACCEGSEEDRGTVQYLQDCAQSAGITTQFVHIEQIGLGEGGVFTDLHDQVIDSLFKLYPWEFMLREDFSIHLQGAGVQWIEPPWKSLLSNKALLPLLWHLNPGHPNLLASYFADDPARSTLGSYVKKPIFAREGANVDVVVDGQTVFSSDGPYGDEGFIYQAFAPLPQFDGNHALIGSWLVDDAPAGISIREDRQLVTQDLSRYLPHVIL